MSLKIIALVFLVVSFNTVKAFGELGPHTKIFVMKGFHLTEKYPSMTGPVQQRSEVLAPEEKGRPVWIKSFGVKVRNEQTGKIESIEYLCHSWLVIPSGTSGPQPMLTISQGMDEMSFPEGFAMKSLNDDSRKIGLLAQALNNSDEKIDKHLSYELTVTYFTDDEAKKQKIRDLQFASFAYKVAKSAGQSHGHLHHHETAYGGASSDPVHFDVPPGRHEFKQTLEPTSDLLKNGGQVKSIKLHLHPYGKSIEIFDLTDGKSLWKGSTKQDPQRAVLTETEGYSDTTGLAIDKSHRYELRVVYDNTTDQTIDAMAVLRLYYFRL